MSFFEYIKMNMVAYSKVRYETDTWYSVDVLLDWEAQTASFFIDGKFKSNTLFFS